MKNKLEGIYQELNSKYKNNGQIDQESLKKDVETLNKQIQGMKASAAKTVDLEKKEKMLKEIRKVEARKENMEGYAKYDSQIVKIKDYRDKLNGKMAAIAGAKQMNESTLKTLKESTIKSLAKQLNAESQKLTKLNKENDPAETVNLTNAEYDALQEEIKKTKEKIAELKKKMDATKKRIVDIEAGNKKADEKIEELKGKVGKCDLAWKTLFTNKGWDEIHVRVYNDKKKLASNTKNASQKQLNQPTTPPPAPILPATKQNEETLTKKITNFIKKAASNIKNFFMGQDENDQNNQKNNAAVNNNIQTKINAIKNNINASNQKDKFIEALRVHVDREFKQEQITKKEKEYIEKHKREDKTK